MRPLSSSCGWLFVELGGAGATMRSAMKLTDCTKMVDKAQAAMSDSDRFVHRVGM
jgi:hypothetical protein